MSEDTDDGTGPTRRNYLRSGSAALVGGLLAGCTGRSGPEATTGTETEAATQTETATETEAATETATATDAAREACLFPVGCREFETAPESVTTYNMGWADMVVALGQAEKLQTNRYSAPSLFYDRFDIEYDADRPPLWQDGGWSKEVMYELDPDLFLIDPNLLGAWDSNWSDEDTREVTENVAPFFGCYNRRIRGEWQQKLDYPNEAPSMLEAFDAVATALGERERADAWLELHDEMQSELRSRTPSADPPSIALINGGSAPGKGEFYVLYLEDDGYEMKPYRDLNLVEADAFAGVETGQYGLTDYETLLEVDPDVILVHWGITTGSVTFGGDGAFDAEQFRADFVEPMENHDVGSKLAAVREGRVYPGPTAEQGPLVNLFQTELTARLFYPDEFGAFDPAAPFEVSEAKQLFDRQRVRDILAGNL
ncbi:ABC transporter substrate-binding protein [Halorussus salinus]|uniref:ABC transporter substrate-binding protein n=1 Tax=Halorussus salinus TaxID=1364935 RepID=UPI00109292F4|nr:ABC transporter substrate-binding protein [Halorussus salinus]